MPAHEIDLVSLFIGFNAGIFAMQAAAHCGARIFFFSSARNITLDCFVTFFTYCRTQHRSLGVYSSDL